MRKNVDEEERFMFKFRLNFSILYRLQLNKSIPFFQMVIYLKVVRGVNNGKEELNCKFGVR